MGINGLPASLRSIVKAIEAAEDLTPQELKSIIAAAKVSHDDLLPFVREDARSHPGKVSNKSSAGN